MQRGHWGVILPACSGSAPPGCTCHKRLAQVTVRWLDHLNWFLSIGRISSSTLCTSKMTKLFILVLRESPANLQRKFISATAICDLSLFFKNSIQSLHSALSLPHQISMMSASLSHAPLSYEPQHTYEQLCLNMLLVMDKPWLAEKSSNRTQLRSLWREVVV